MMVLTRKVGQEIRIGHGGAIRILVCRIYGDQVRIGIEAPDGVPVDRLEVFRRKEAEKG